jgi:hypothetical protein
MVYVSRETQAAFIPRLDVQATGKPGKPRQLFCHFGSCPSGFNAPNGRKSKDGQKKV